MTRNLLSIALALVPILLINSCRKDLPGGEQYGIFAVTNDTTVVVNGTLDGNAEQDWDALVADYQDIRLMVLEDCPGSTDDDANLRMALDIHRQGVNMHLRSNSSIESGAVDLYLAGNQRTREMGAKVGVHTWEDTSGLQGGELPRTDEQHSVYLNYYTNVGLTQQEASDFYFFTLAAASSNDIHYMTEAELERFDFFTNE